MIVDASVAVPWLIETPFSAAARRLRPSSPCAPTIMLLETTNVLLKYRRIGGLSDELIDQALRQLHLLVTDIADDRTLLSAATEISRSHNHKIYDCLYLALAQQRRRPLATADRRMAVLAGRLGIETELVEPSL